jgi:DNA-binding NarL/FixJ family response regulator
MLLNLEPDIRVVGVAQDGAEAIELAARHQPDLILMDLKMPDSNGICGHRNKEA